MLESNPRIVRGLGATPLVLDEVASLAARGLDVDIADPKPRYTLPAQTQQAVDIAIREQVSRPDFAGWLFDREVHPAGWAWWRVAKRAIALHTLYRIGELERPSDGIEPDVFDENLFEPGESSARSIIRREQPDRARKILDRYDEFLDGGLLDDGRDGYGLNSRDYLIGTTDSHAVRTRADVAKQLVREHFAAKPPAHLLRSVSVACGAADPIFELAAELEEAGAGFRDISFIDHDPLALAMVTSIARQHGFESRLTTLRKNLIKTPMVSYIPPASVDVVDLIGVFEHIPRSRYGYRLASNLLAAAGEIARPGGVIVLGNMLTDRPQQEFFDSVWPRLQQRTIAEALRLFAEAGFGPENVKARVPMGEGVYAVYAIEVPEHPRRASRDRLSQRALGKLLTRGMPEY